MKKKKQWIISKEIQISIFAILIVVVAILTVYYFNVSQTQFTITKEVCGQEEIGQKLVGYYNETCNQTITFEGLVCADWGCGDWHIAGKFCYDEIDIYKEDFPCDSELCKFDNFVDFGDGASFTEKIYVKKENYTIQHENYEPITKTICHEEEVDEIEVTTKIEGDTCSLEKTIESRFTCSYNETTKELKRTVWILKQDLTTEWLNENAEECYSESFGTWEKIIVGHPYDEGFCSKYKLGNYTISVK